MADDEKLYRCVKPQYANEQGRLSSQAFTHRSRRVSVDRAKLCGNDPAHVKVAATDFVCSMITGQVRAIPGVVRKTSGGEVSVQHIVRVDPEPLAHNPAHASIYGDPEITSDKVFKRLKESLRILAEWEEGFSPRTRSRLDS